MPRWTVVEYARDNTEYLIRTVAKIIELAVKTQDEINDLANDMAGYYEWKNIPELKILAEYHGHMEDFRVYLGVFLVELLQKAQKEN